MLYTQCNICITDRPIKQCFAKNRHYPISRPLLGIAGRVNYQSLIYVARVCESAGTQNYNSAFCSRTFALIRLFYLYINYFLIYDPGYTENGGMGANYAKHGS